MGRKKNLETGGVVLNRGGDLDEATIEFLEGFSKLFASISSLSIPAQRASLSELFHVPESELEPVDRVEDKIIRGRHGSIPIRLFSPHKGGELPVIVYFHSGGWVYGDIEGSESFCRHLANLTGSVVASVGYRLAPEHKFPIPLEDCYDATKWIVENAHIFLGNPTKVILCGESAGGNLAAAVTLMIRRTKEFKVAAHLLLYPVLTSDLNQEHYDNSPDKSLLSYENMKFFWKMYLGSTEDGDNPLASPLKNTDFTRLPPCFIVTAEHDALKHEGEGYKEALQQAGVSVQYQCYPKVIHGFLDLPLDDATKKRAFGDVAAWVKSI